MRGQEQLGGDIGGARRTLAGVSGSDAVVEDDGTYSPFWAMCFLPRRQIMEATGSWRPGYVSAFAR